MNPSNFKKSVVLDKQYKARIDELVAEVAEMEWCKEQPGYNAYNKTIGNATANIDFPSEVSDIIFAAVSESHEDEIISMNRERIKQLKEEQWKESAKL